MSQLCALFRPHFLAVLCLSIGAIALSLGGCGLRPLYSDGAQGAVAQVLAGVEVAPIEGRAGWLVREALQERLSATQASGAPRYRVHIRLDDSITAVGVQLDDSITREQRRLRARYQLVDLQADGGGGAVVLDTTAAATIGISAVGSEYATIAAEKTALERLSQDIAEQITVQIALYARQADSAAQSNKANSTSDLHR